ncbi:ATP-binding protein [Clostridium gasigenes]|uniref:ATP-binding protein n=1 Tax=Clostridium gasigenes TaxID=94869 RepID=UPI001C0E0232|nr:ATP-binding protein [Clostridium gasigenes]
MGNDKGISLNIGEKYLTNWEIYHALRELIANALDVVGNDPKKVKIYRDSKNRLCIKDEGNGIKPENFKLEESKSDNANRIGKFGVGLKDAIGVLKSRGKEIEIQTNLYKYEFKYNESAVGNVIHIHIKEHRINIKGTKIIISNIAAKDEELAKNEFIIYSRISPIFSNKFGDIIEEDEKSLYYNGVRICKIEGEYFKFSYNINGNINKIDDGLNRERRYVSRSICTKAIQNIINNSSEEVLEKFLDTLSYEDKGRSVELTWESCFIKVVNWGSQKRKLCLVTDHDIENHKEEYNQINRELDRVIIKITKKEKNIIINKCNVEVRNIFLVNISTYNESMRKWNFSEKEIYVLEKAKSLFKKYSEVDKELLENLVVIDKYGQSLDSDREKIIIRRNNLNTVGDAAVAILKQLNIINGSSQFEDYILTKYI